MATSKHPTGPAADQDKAHTPDVLRNDKARWKEHDMPDQPDDEGQVRPEDYDRGPRVLPDPARRR